MRGLKLALTFWAEAYLLNFFWEAWHAYYLYEGYHGKSFSNYSIPDYLFLVGRASFADAGLLLIIFLVGFLIWPPPANLAKGGEDWYWFTMSHAEGFTLSKAEGFGSKKSGYQKLTYFLITTIGVAAWIEIKGVYILHEWSYLPAMPTVFGLGVSPILQLAITGATAFWLL